MNVEPQQEHQWLQKLVGEWTYESVSNAGPDQPEMKLSGTESVRSLGGLWVICEGQGAGPDGGVGTTVMTLGYDPQKKQYIGTWIGSMMNYLWLYAGELSPDATTLALESEGPDFSGAAKLATYRDIIEFKSDDYRLLRAEVRGEDGSWHQFMTTHYRRTR